MERSKEDAEKLFDKMEGFLTDYEGAKAEKAKKVNNVTPPDDKKDDKKKDDKKDEGGFNLLSWLFGD